MKVRQDIVNKINSLSDQIKEAREDLEKLDYADRLANAKQYENKYYMEVQDHHVAHVRCVFVYGTNTETCEPKAVEIRYWSDNNDWFCVENHSNFRMRDWDEDKDKWKLITEKEFLDHYHQVIGRVNAAIYIEKIH
jgi:hypothetical protein